ncbi:lytic transglycosylase [Rhodospirillum rubrum]|uniref:lytic transglycosylase domain-containing protein n=1 Tax=Rhodospirillum rubrum TaxID=1085 RepID=UPI001904CE06|nr:lytic transglycosylase domain-containing protein [Rhodospirillum rubrum]MBK1666049.1 lytic transglycosylase [Rhodospirillum rubrum]MBK1678174.1 lytic transglycosylase [Rhodospirillum rubrum]
MGMFPVGRWVRTVVLGCCLMAAAESAAANPPGAVLDPADVARYRTIFALQDKGLWSDADREILGLEDPLLMGHVRYQRLMHPTAYRANADELRTWLATYVDHPCGQRLLRLAQRRGVAPPIDPDAPLFGDLGSGEVGNGPGWGLEGVYPPGQRATAQERWEIFLRALGAGQTLRMKELITGARNDVLADIDQDRMKAALAFAYFIEGRDEWAIAWAREAIARSGKRLPIAHWAGGLALWRSGKPAEALGHFEEVIAAPGTSPWLRSAGAFWAARSALRARHPERVSALLERAAAEPRTFYGLVALRALGRPMPFSWNAPKLSERGWERLERLPGARRAMALVQIGRSREAAEELAPLYAGAGPELRDALLGATLALGLPTLALDIGRTDPRAGDVARFPLPPWSPDVGWSLDRALIYAFSRQESAFDPQAVSPAGALGLMQLMPATASHVAGDRALADAEGGEVLFQPTVNLSLGQAYLAELLASSQIRGNLFFLATAYNSGPGRLAGWLREGRHDEDPLLFIESIGSRETRLFIERVLTNYWAYRSRLDQSLSSLDAVAAGDWPRYQAAKPAR